jgi:hypothetical protein
LQDVVHYDLRDFRKLEDLDAKWGRVGFDMALPDSVLQRWAVPFLRSRQLQFVPVVDLRVEDSTSGAAQERLRDAANRLSNAYLLRAEDITARDGSAGCSPVWSSGGFELVDTRVCKNVLALGSGWYRMERNPRASVQWQRQFRWMRKRGELLLFHPSAAALRLQFTAVAGYGNPSPDRTIRLFVNGEPFDEIRVSGYARVVTKPFVAPQPWARMEFEIQERAAPLPRALALWNGWIPSDPRLLNVAFHDIGVIGEEAEAPARTEVDFHSQDEFSSVDMNGVYADRWMGSQASIELSIPAGASRLELQGMVPGVSGFSFPYAIRAFADGAPLGEVRVGSGAFHVRFPLNRWKWSAGRAARNAHVVIQTQATFIGRKLGVSPDQRPLSIRLDRIGTEQRIGNGPGAASVRTGAKPVKRVGDTSR